MLDINIIIMVHFTLTNRKRQEFEINAEDIILRDIRNNDLNQVEFSLFVQSSDGVSVLPADTLKNTITVKKILCKQRLSQKN